MCFFFIVLFRGGTELVAKTGKQEVCSREFATNNDKSVQKALHIVSTGRLQNVKKIPNV